MKKIVFLTLISILTLQAKAVKPPIHRPILTAGDVEKAIKKDPYLTFNNNTNYSVYMILEGETSQYKPTLSKITLERNRTTRVLIPNNNNIIASFWTSYNKYKTLKSQYAKKYPKSKNPSNYSLQTLPLTKNTEYDITPQGDGLAITQRSTKAQPSRTYQFK